MKIGFGARFKEFFDNLLSVVYPLNCFICGKRINQNGYSPLCAACFGRIKKLTPPFCIGCGVSLVSELTPSNICAECRGRHHSFERAWSSSNYEGVMRSCIHYLKYGKHISLASLLGRVLTDFARKYMSMERFDCIIPVPLHSTKLREREFNQAQLLAQCLSDNFNKKLLLRTLLRIKYTIPQSELTPKERKENVKGVFAIRNPLLIKGKNILIVDDVFTTGATLEECALLLKRNGASSIETLTLAR